MNKLLALVFAISLSSCNREKENFEFTFFRWSIHEDYYLKINSSDTIYLIVDNPIEKYTKFTIVNKNEKDKIESFLENTIFPKKEHFSRDVNDGLSYAFIYTDKQRRNKLLLHAKAGPKEFWEFGEYLESLKKKSNFISATKKIDLKEVQKLIFIPFPPKPSNGH